MRVEEMVERVWPGRDAQIELLGGGITNRNFKVVLDDGAYVLRIGGKDTELLGIDRRVEHEASLVAAAVGVGPEVVTFVEPEGYLVTRFVEGSVVEPEAIREPEALRRVAQSLRAVHAGPPIPTRFDSFRVVEAYAVTAAAHGIRVPDAYAPARELANRIEHRRGPAAERPCHNDLLTANFIDDGTRIRIVDWEYAGMGDVFFDLANFSVNNGLSRDESSAFLAAYFGQVGPEEERRLTLMRFMSDFREAMWGVVQQALSDLEFDFGAYADEHFERLQRTASERSFRRALGWRT
jgi:thiamine kinase-like enzyme